MGDANKRAQQIEWVEISTYIAALDCALDQCIDCTPDVTAGRFIEL